MAKYKKTSAYHERLIKTYGKEKAMSMIKKIGSGYTHDGNWVARGEKKGEYTPWMRRKSKVFSDLSAIGSNQSFENFEDEIGGLA